MIETPASPSASWKWGICGLLLLATMLNYMDRQTLAQTAKTIKQEYGLSNEQYGDLEFGFGMAFAAGGIITGLIADRVNVRVMYPVVLLGWSLAGFATAYANQVGAAIMSLLPSGGSTDAPVTQGAEPAYYGLLFCRIVLGLFEAGQWPCALITTQRILAQRERTFGNGLLQSGASIGAILTPLVVRFMVTDEPGSWRGPFQAIGALGMFWVVPWLVMTRGRELGRPSSFTRADAQQIKAAEEAPRQSHAAQIDRWQLVRRFAALAVVVTMINLTWQFFRAWLPLFLGEFHQYEEATVQYFTSSYYIASDVGCIGVGFLVTRLIARGWRVHSARMATFFACALMVALCTTAAFLPSGTLLLVLLLVIGFATLGLFPNYYSFTQELSGRHQGKITGAFTAITWPVTAVMQKLVGRSIDLTHSYATGIAVACLAPMAACLAMWFLWNWPSRQSETPI